MTVEPATEDAAAIAASLLAALEKTGDTPVELLEQLCSMAAADDPATARIASSALFQHVVEPLGDRFDPAMDALYVRFFSSVIEYCRRQPAFGTFDLHLRSLGVDTRRQLLARAAGIRNPRPYAAVSNAEPESVQIVLAPSRVTLGADVAITSVILRRMKTLFSAARIALLGNAKAGALFASDPRVDLVEAAYPRGGTLRERLDAWVALSQAVSQHIADLPPDAYVIVDPDSRLTQLGLLPLTADDSRYYFFESRSYSPSSNQSLAWLTGRWLDEVFAFPGKERIELDDPTTGPYVALSEEDAAGGRALRSKVPGRLAAVNLGVGGNREKRVEDPFELELVVSLLDAGYTPVLDRGAGDEELERTNRLIAALKGRGKSAGEAPPDGEEAPAADVLAWEGSLSGFGGIIAAADLYVGYDSAGGHLAAALGTPLIDIFTDAAPPRMRERWTPWGEGSARVITVGRLAPREALRQLRSALREQPR